MAVGKSAVEPGLSKRVVGLRLRKCAVDEAGHMRNWAGDEFIPRSW